MVETTNQNSSPSTMSFVGNPSARSLSDNGRYISFVENAVRDYDVFKSFKKNPDYKGILEHVSPELGLRYLEIVASQDPALFADINKFRINDVVGDAEIVRYGDIVDISPSTLRYVKVASDIRTLFGDTINGGRVAEIGVGYGGQMLVLDPCLSG